MAYTPKYDPNLLKKINTARQQKFRKPQGVFETALDWLDRPGQFIRGGIYGLQTGQNPFSTAWQGLSGQNRIYGSDILQNAGMKEGFGRAATGFGLDVLLDPLTYIGVGALTKAGKAASGLGKLSEVQKIAQGTRYGMSGALKGIEGFKDFSKIAKPGMSLAATKAGQVAQGQRSLISMFGKPIVKGEKVYEGLDKAGQFLKTNKYTRPTLDTVGQMFSTRYRPGNVSPEDWKKLMEAKDTAKASASYGKAKALDFAVDLKGKTEAAMEVLKKKGMRPYEAKAAVDNLLQTIERKGTAQNVIPELRPLLDELSGFAGNIQNRRKAIGKGLINEEDYNYWLHTLSPEAKPTLGNKISNALQGGSKEFTTKSASDISRKYLKLGTGEVVNLKTGALYKGGQQVGKLAEKELKHLARVDEYKTLLAKSKGAVTEAGEAALTKGNKEIRKQQKALDKLG